MPYVLERIPNWDKPRVYLDNQKLAPPTTCAISFLVGRNESHTRVPMNEEHVRNLQGMYQGIRGPEDERVFLIQALNYFFTEVYPFDIESTDPRFFVANITAALMWLHQELLLRLHMPLFPDARPGKFWIGQVFTPKFYDRVADKEWKIDYRLARSGNLEFWLIPLVHRKPDSNDKPSSQTTPAS